MKLRKKNTCVLVHILLSFYEKGDWNKDRLSIFTTLKQV
jgi:hypothetical protein